MQYRFEEMIVSCYYGNWSDGAKAWASMNLNVGLALSLYDKMDAKLLSERQLMQLVEYGTMEKHRC